MSIFVVCESCIQNGTFCLRSHIFRGGHGDVFRAFKLMADDLMDKTHTWILKRMHVLHNPAIELCALREIYFGSLLVNKPFVARYVSHFITPTDYWLVFHDEGVSLQQASA